MKYLIVPISENHIEGFNAAVDTVSREQKYLTFLEGPSLEMSREFVLKSLLENRPHFIALDGSKVIGWCDISSLNRPVYLHSGVLGIGVLANYRGQGVGEALIRAALNKAKLIGLTRVELTLRENNKTALALYKKIGFEVEGFQRNAVRINNQYENNISMSILFE